MKVYNTTFQSPYTNALSNPAFCAVHPAKYYLKCEDGQFHEVLSSKVIKSLQRKLVVWLNKTHNDSLRSIQPIHKTDVDKNIRERVVRFFINRDKDYRAKSYVRSFYTTNKERKTEAYILTGKSADIVEDAAKPIEMLHSYLKERAGVISDYNCIDLKEAKEFITKQAEVERMAVLRHYHNKAKFAIRRILQTIQPENSLFEAYFKPHPSGSSIKYELVDAKFNGK